MYLNYEGPKTVYKGWGSETWHILAKDFCVKTINILSGHKTSYQYHEKKEEVNFIKAGKAEVWLEDENGAINKYIMKEGDSFFVPVTRKHRVIALTDLEMFEVSNEYVDDVIRINDEFGRGNGKIESEHKTPAVLILAAGLGSRLGKHTENKNKALVPVGSKAAISHIIEQFPVNYEIVVAVGYCKESLQEYCLSAHSDRKFHFVEVDGWDNPKTDPGHSALACKHLLQRQFYLTAVDSIIDEPLPHIDGNWIGIWPTAYPEKYATLLVKNGNVEQVVNKSSVGYSSAFMGLAAILDYGIFWSELEKSPSHELVSAWKNPPNYPTLKAKTLKWFDVGNLDDLSVASDRRGGQPLNSPKDTGECVYRVGNKILKFHPDKNVTKNRLERARYLGNWLPKNCHENGHFMIYDWQEGENLYKHDSLFLYRRVLENLSWTFAISSRAADKSLSESFYIKKTEERVKLFAKKYGKSYIDNPLSINGVDYPAVNEVLKKANINALTSNPLYGAFHGDLHFDNIIYDEKRDSLVYIDWRESYAGSTKHGDIYYDLGKLYAGCLVCFEQLKDDSAVRAVEGENSISYSLETTDNLSKFLVEYDKWITDQGFDLGTVKTVAGLALLNIVPLHTYTWGLALFAKGIEILHDVSL